jgi:hypothetical protein
MNGEIDAFTIKKFCWIQNDRTLQKKHICGQNKLHAEQYSISPPWQLSVPPHHKPEYGDP